MTVERLGNREKNWLDEITNGEENLSTVLRVCFDGEAEHLERFQGSLGT